MARVNRLTCRQIMATFLLGVIPLAAHALSITPYPGARIDAQLEEERGNHPIISSNMKKVNGVVLADETRRLDGKLTRVVYQLPEGHGSRNAYDFFVKQLKAGNVEPLFVCSSFSCGDSNFWANNVFEVARLYGPSREQNYYVGSVMEADQLVYYTLYTIRRGNRRVYALVDRFEAENAAGTSTRQGFILGILPQNAVQLSRSDAYRKALSALQGNDANKVVVLVELAVSIPSGVSAVDSLQEQMQSLSAMVQQQLENDGIPPDRIRILPSVMTSTAVREPSIRFFLTQ